MDPSGNPLQYPLIGITTLFRITWLLWNYGVISYGINRKYYGWKYIVTRELPPYLSGITTLFPELPPYWKELRHYFRN